MGEWLIQTYVCDNGIEYKTKFYVPDVTDIKKSTRRKERSVRRAEKNATEAAHEVGRLLNCNFRVGIDYYIGLDYSDEGLAKLTEKAGAMDGFTEDEALVLCAKKEWVNLMRRVKRRAAEKGLEIKALDIVSVTDPDTGEVVRIHHHAVVNAAVVEIFKECWNMGEVYARKLRSKHGVDLQELANYMMAQAARIGADKRYTHTRNLARAIVRKPVKARNENAELQVPKGCQMIWRSEYVRGWAQHIRYYRPPREKEYG